MSDPPVAVLDPSIPRACFSLDEVDCVRALDAASRLLSEGLVVRYIEVGPFGCQAGEGCPTTLLARPAGSVMFELANGETVEVMVTAAPDGALEVAPREPVRATFEPSSARGVLGGPMPFSLQHCGLWSGIDIDGSWWDPVGFVNADHGDAINAADGVFVPSDPNHATYTSDRGLVVNLVRRDGPKSLQLCG